MDLLQHLNHQRWAELAHSTASSRHCRTWVFKASFSELTTDPTVKQDYQRVFSGLKDSKWSQTGGSQSSIQQETLKHKTRDDKRQQQFNSEGKNYHVLGDCATRSCWVFAVHSTSRCHISYYAYKTGSLSREDAETLTRYKKPYIMHCSYKWHVSSQKSVGNGLRPIKTWQTFLLGLEIPKSALPAPFPPSQPSPRGGVLMLSPLWKKLFDFSQC